MDLFDRKKANILVVEDEPTYQRSLQVLLDQEGFEVTMAGTFEAAKNILNQNAVDVALVDLQLPDKPGMELVSWIVQHFPTTQAVVLTGNSSIESAVEATKRGALAYVVKPFEKDNLLLTIRNAIETSRLKSENAHLKANLKKEISFENIVGASTTMQHIFRTIEKIASTDSTVLITGDSGTGKELIARAIHFNSDRSKHHMIAVNCGAIPEDLLESELFGHVKGAFTGATANRVGRFEAAHRGTLFLDEIGDMPLSLQVKLLRVLQDKFIQAVGCNHTKEINVRIIAATNQDLTELIQNKLFREDLYYRLNVIHIHVPPVRDRKEDIPMLIKFFNAKHCQKHERGLLELDPSVLQVLIDYEWPGNIRELENLVEQLVVFKEGEQVVLQDLPRRFWKSDASPVNPSDLISSIAGAPLSSLQPPYMKLPEGGLDFKDIINQFEDTLLMQALERTRWNKNRAAKLLAMNRTTLVEKLKKKRIAKPDESVTDEA
jgi:DNA-binding NtrC family response regulator